MSCPGIDIYQRLAAGQLPIDERALVANHASSCPECQQLVEALVTRGGLAAAISGRIEVGAMIGDRFRIDQILGAGGMGVVVAATHVELGNRVAIKWMRAELLHDSALVERFVREARAVARLRTEHVCKVFDVARLETGAPYIVMELLEGTDLAHSVAHKPLPVTITINYVLQACVALAEAHAAGIIHRDLKPANLFVVRRPDGEPLVKILDFGIAKVLDDDTSRTRTHAVLGSPGYMSPEQLRSARDVDVRSDIWALGVTLYQLLAARMPFPGATPDEIARNIQTEPPIALDVDPALRAVVFRCLDKAPERRYQDVASLAADLSPFGDAAARDIARAITHLSSAPAVAASDPPLDPVGNNADKLVGRRFGEFVLRERIGAGGFGAVYRATQSALDREAVVKVLYATHTTERFLREAKLASKLDHPYAAHVYAFGAERDGTLWIAMELVRGTPLDQVLKLHGPLPLERFIPLLERICEVVHTAHEQGIVHRDIKPANLMILSRAGRLLPKLLDFGIAKGHGAADPIAHAPVAHDSTDHVSRAVDLTQRGAIIGSPAYMAPEQWADAGLADARTDLYALGTVAYECLAGKPPFDVNSHIAAAEAHAKQAVPALGPHFPPALDAVFAKVLAKRPADRYADALELAVAFRNASGIPHDPMRLPMLDPAVRDATINEAPQPIAEAIAGYEAAHNVHHARDALVLAARVIARYLALLAIQCRSRFASDVGRFGAMRALAQRTLADAEWIELARQLGDGWLAQRDAYPVPELIDVLHDRALLADLAALLALRDAEDGNEAELVELLRASVARLTRVLAGLAFSRHYPLVVALPGGLAERWMGTRRTQRSTIAVRGKQLPEGAAALLDEDGAPLVMLAPLFAIAPPAPGAARELFMFDGRHHRGARFLALPARFEHHDDAIWDWFRTQLADTLDRGQLTAGEEQAPYRGLSAFSVDDSPRFFGREKQTDTFINRLQLQPLLAVVGRSGAGKSSFVQAGVLAALPGWRAITLRPGPAPLASLAARLEHAGIAADLRSASGRAVLGSVLRADAAMHGPIVLVIDQLEELFTLCDDTDERRWFAEAIAATAGSTEVPVRVICTLRDDFLVRTEEVPALRNRISQGLQLLTVPVADDLLRILVEPARRAGYEFDDATLPTEMVAEVADQPGALALLSFTAAQLWALRDTHFKRLTRAVYETLGGVGGALARHADQTFDAMPADERAVAREVFRHLVSSQHTRAVLGGRELRQLLGNHARADSVIERLIAARLLVASENETGGETVEIVHEALLVAWPRLVEWQREDTEGARFREQLRSAATQWNERGRPRGLVWLDDAFADYTRWRARHLGPLTDTEAAFAAASAREATRNRRNRGLLLFAAFVALVTIAIVLLVSKQRTEAANRLLQDNLRRQWEARGQRDLLDGKPLEALVELARAGELGARGRVHDFLVAEAIAATEGAELTLVHGGEVRYPRFSHDDSRVITGSLDNRARIWDARTGKLLYELPTGGAVARTAFSPDDRTVLTASLDGTVRWWDAATGKELRGFTHGGAAWCALYLPDGKTALTAGEDDTVALWELATGVQKLRVHGDGAGIHVCAISPDGTRFAAGDNRGVTRVWDAKTGALLHRYAEQTTQVTQLAFSPDGTRLVAAADEPIAYEWDTATGAVVRLAHADLVYAVSFSPDGKRILTASLERLAFVWDADSGRKLFTFAGHIAGVTRAIWSPDGNFVVTASEDSSARLWSAHSGRQLANWQRHGKALFDVSFAHRSQRIVTASNDKTAIIWNVRPQQPTLELATPPGTYWAAVSRDGARAAIASANGVVTVWNTSTGARLAELGHTGERRIVHTAFDATGTRVAATSEDDVVRIWELAHPDRPPREIRGPRTSAATADWSPDDRMIAVATDDGYLRVWDAATGTLRFEKVVRDGAAVWSVVFAPDSQAIATAAGGAIQFWDLDGKPRPPLEDRDQLVGLAYSPHGQRALLRTTGPMAKIRDFNTGAEVRLLGHAAAVTRMAWHPSGDIVATGSLDGTARLWDAETGTQLSVVSNIGHEVSVAFSFDGRLLVAGDNGTTIITTLPRYQGTAQQLQRLIACRVPFEVADDQVRPRERAYAGCDGM
jgi:serine/threonine protein kinase/WD40 repeat protein